MRETAQKKLRELYACLRAVAPDATESIKWSMPAFSHTRILFTFAGFAGHVGLYTTPSTLRAFAPKLTKFKTGKGSVQFPLDRPLPRTLITAIARYRVRELRISDVRWM